MLAFALGVKSVTANQWVFVGLISVGDFLTKKNYECARTLGKGVMAQSDCIFPLLPQLLIFFVARCVEMVMHVMQMIDNRR